MGNIVRSQGNNLNANLSHVTYWDVSISQTISRILLQKSWSCQITRKGSSNPDLLSVVVLQRAALGLLKLCVQYVQRGQIPGNVCSLHRGWPTCQWLTRIQSRSPVPCSRQDKLCNVIYISKLPHTSGWGCQKFHFCLVSFPFHLCFPPSLLVSLGSMSSLNYFIKTFDSGSNSGSPSTAKSCSKLF